jgi:DNA polymerase-4
MASARAARLCPRAIFVPPDFSKYKEASRRIREIFLSVSDRVEPLALDEAYLDVTENKLGEPLASRVAAHIRQRIREELSLTASAGVGPNKFIAKLASDLRKPDALVVIPPEKVEAFVENLPVEKLWGVGPATAKRLIGMGLPTTAHLRNCPPVVLEKTLGKFGLFLHRLAHGIDHREVVADRRAKSRGSETTFERDILQLERLREVVQELSDDVASSLKRIEAQAQTITLKLRYRDFRTVSRSYTLPQLTDETAAIATVARELLAKTEAGKVPVRLVGVSVSHLSFPDEPLQLRLFAEP